MGYYRAGFEVTGVDIEPQPNYPFDFIQKDVFELDLDFIRSFDVVGAAPPCQAFSVTRHKSKRVHPELIIPTRKLLRDAGRPYVIENVEGAPLENPITLCGSSFGLRVRRHRLFESSESIVGKPCDHGWQLKDKRYTVRRSASRGGPYKSGTVPVHGSNQLADLLPWESELEIASEAMGIDWMTKEELNQAIPPKYSFYIGKQLIDLLGFSD